MFSNITIQIQTQHRVQMNMIKAQELSVMKVPMVLNKILMPVVRLMALDPSVCLEECFNPIRVIVRLHLETYDVALSISER